MKNNMHLYTRPIFSALLGLGLLISGFTYGQENNNQDDHQQEEIIIKRKGNLDKPLDVQINKDEININGKPLSEYKGGDIDVMRSKSDESNNDMGFQMVNPGGGMQPFGNDDDSGHGFSYSMPHNSNKALLGVYTRKDSSQSGAYVMQVSSGSAADKGGLKTGDIITKVNNDQINAPADLVNAISNYEPGTTVTVNFIRNGKKMSKQVTLTANDNDDTFSISPGNMPRSFQPFMQQMPRNHFRLFQMPMDDAPKLGMRVEESGDNNAGVEVLTVEKNSAADKAGVKEGDYITQFAGQPVNTVQDIVEAKNNNAGQADVKVQLVRKGKTMTVDLNMPQAKHQTDL